MPDPAGKGPWDDVLRDASIDIEVRCYMLLAITCGDFDNDFLDRLGAAGGIIKGRSYGNGEEERV
jgi:hypothetical protein